MVHFVNDQAHKQYDGYGNSERCIGCIGQWSGFIYLVRILRLQFSLWWEHGMQHFCNGCGDVGGDISVVALYHITIGEIKFY
jgi:hypothetical protein